MDVAKNGGVRSRLVCQDFNNDKKHSDEMFAPTPPLLASRWCVSRMASQGWSGPGSQSLMALDFSKAFLYTDMQRRVFIELPDEDTRKRGKESVGLLRKSIYGFRDAPQTWQRVVKDMLERRGYVSLIATQCVYVNPKNGVVIVAHVDDFLCGGAKKDLVHLLADLQGEFECSAKMLGPEDDEENEIKFLGRMIRLTSAGLEWEGDAKHAKACLEKMNLGDLKGVETPGTKSEGEVKEGVREQVMSPIDAKLYRGCVALLNFMSQDRVDTCYASKEVSKTMSNPRPADWIPLKRIARYLTSHPRCVSLFAWQGPIDKISVFTDSDWGGDLKTRRSTSGGCTMRGLHLISHWSRTQQVVALSSAEAELNGICKAAAEGLCAVNLSKELLESLPVEIFTDASAARGVVQRQGAGRIKHLQVKQLWVQEKESSGDLIVTKIPRALNWADLLTHHWTENDGATMMAGMSVVRRS